MGGIKRVGLIGFGQIGAALHQAMVTRPELNLEPAFVHEVQAERAKLVPPGLALADLAGLAARRPDLVVEAAHPEAVRRHALAVLASHDLMIMSVSALADAALEEALRRTCRERGTRLFIPHGAVLGLDGLRDGLSVWETVTITMRKNPRNLDFAAAGRDGRGIASPTVLYDGPTRGVLPLYPKNVNSHATLALATLGLDKTRSILVADPSLEESIIEIEAQGAGNSIRIERRNPIKGVTGQLTILSVVESLRAIFGAQAAVNFV